MKTDLEEKKLAYVELRCINCKKKDDLCLFIIFILTHTANISITNSVSYLNDYDCIYSAVLKAQLEKCVTLTR